MPIKFRCQHCDHLLGISRKKAGEQFDCPACGRGIRVPDLDGNTRPVEEQQLRTNDPKLMDAFRELDEIDTTPRPITLEPRVRVSGVVLNPLPKNEPKELGVVRSNIHAKEEESDEIDVYEELKPILLSPPNQRNMVRRESFNAASWFSLTFILVLVAFGGGYYLGASNQFGQKEPQIEDQTKKPVGDNDPAPPQPGAYLIKGQVNYKQPSGETRPDRGARIFLLPQKYAGGNKLPANGFRAGDSAEEFAQAKLALEKLGGSATIVKDDGRYEFTVQESGDFSLVIVSRFAERTDNEIVTALVVPILVAFFEKPNEVIGKVGCHAHTVNLNNKPNIDWDYVFAP